MLPTLRTLLAAAALLPVTRASAQVIINEIHYNPIERPAFAADGTPVFQGTATPANFSEDVHEFLELHNPTAEAINLSGWRLASGIEFTFPAGTTIGPGGHLVVAKNPARIQAVYGITGVVGPYSGQLGNRGDNVRLLTPGNVVSDAVSYESNFPWAISANRLGANDDFTLLNSAAYQYKGRSLQRVSKTAASNDPANWIAARPAGPSTTFADLPTPGAANIVTRDVPKPVVFAHSATQLTDGAAIIRSGSQVRIVASFTSDAALSNVEVEYFNDNVNVFGEARTTLAMTSLGNNQFTATLPAQGDRAIIRYRIKANRGDGIEVVSPRADDPAIVPTGMTAREGWHAYFVTPFRSSSKPIYDCFVSTDGQALSDSLGANVYPFNGLNGLQTIAYNATGNLRRIVASGTITAAYPRELGWPGVTTADRQWNGTVPAVFIENGRVRDAQIRFHGSRYNRRPSRKSYKLLFADYQLYLSADSVFITDKGDAFMTAHGLHQQAGLPLSDVRYVDWYFNSDGLQTRLEQGEYNGDLLDLYHEKMQRLNPGSAKEGTGELYKSAGVILGSGNATFPPGNPSGGEGPYATGNAWPLPATGGSPAWTELQRYDYTYGLQNHAWVGSKPIRDMINGMWAARGDSYSAPNPNVGALRTWLQQTWDVETELTSLAVGNWMCPWDDTTQNHFFWRRTNGKWVRLLWDFDSMYGGGSPATSSIYHGEVGDPANNFRGPHYTKDSVIKAFRQEYKERLWFLNNTLFDPNNLAVLTFKNSGGSDVTYATSIGAFATARFDYVNQQVNLGVFYKPTRPINSGPANNAAVLPGANLVGSNYDYRAARTLAVAPSVSPHTTSKWEIRAETGSYNGPVFVLASTVNLTSLPIPFDQLTYGQRYFWRVTYFDALGRPSITSAETAFTYGTATPGSGSVRINEVMAENLTAVSNGADYPDYVELKNTTAGSVDIGGWKLTDDELNPSKFVFPTGTSIPANSHLVVWCDNNHESPGLHSGFGLSRLGQRVLLLSETNVVRDAIAFGPQAPNSAIGRITDGTGGWTLVNPSAGAANTAAPFSTATSTLKINEWMATPASGDDWFEIHNSGPQPVALAGLWLSDTPGTPKVTQIPALSFIAAGGCARFDADGTTSGFNRVNFRLGGGGDNIVLTATNGVTVIDAVTFGAQQTGVSEGRFPDSTAAIVSFPLSPSPNDNNWLPASVRINEVLSSSVPPLEDYVEIHNPTAAEVDISKWWLSDDRSAKQKYQFPDGTTIPAGGYLVVTESQFNVGANAFALSSLGEDIVLSAADASGALTGERSQLSFGATADGVSLGYMATATAPDMWPQVSRTPEAPNSEPVIGPVVINEVHYHPPDLSGADNLRDEFVELHNISRAHVDLTGWTLKGGAEFAFPPGTIINRGDYIIIVGFDPADTVTRDAFRAALGVPESVQMFGPFSPRLANDTEDVEIARPFTSQSGATRLVNVDKVEYADYLPWPIAADGSGASLQRISRASIGNDAANWSASTPTPGGVNTGQGPLVHAVIFQSQPLSQTVNPGTLVTFTVTTDGTAPISYQWRKDGIDLAGKTEATLSLTAAEGDEGSYDVVATNTAGPVASLAAQLTVNDPVVITTQPLSRTVNTGTIVTFSVAGTGTAPFTFQWRKNEQPIEGETGDSLTITASAGTAGSYDVIVSNIVGPTTSAAAVLVANDPVQITRQPEPQTVNPGSPASFIVEVTGTAPFQFQWRKGGTPIAGATNAQLVIDSAQESDEGSYDVIISNPAGDVTSSAAALSVNDPVQITMQPADQVVNPNGRATFSVAATGTGELSFQWRRNGAPIDGATSASYAIASVGSSDLGAYDVLISNVVGDVASASAELSFLDWATSAGNYQGALIGEDVADPASDPYPGRATIALAKTGKFTGKLDYFGITHSFRGQLDVNLETGIVVTRKNDSPVTLALRLNGAEKRFEIEAANQGAAGQSPATASAPQIPKRSRTAPAAVAGRYTVVLTPEAGRPADMNARGFVTLKIAPTGAVSWAGKLPDTAPLRGSAMLTAENEAAFYNKLYVPKAPLAGHIAGPMSFANGGVEGSLGWRKPAQTKGEFWRTGFQALATAEGEAWIAPPRAVPAVPPGPLTLRLELPSSPDPQDFGVAFTAQGRFLFDPPNSPKLALSLNRVTGQLTGKYFDATFGKPRAMHGVFLQKQMRGDGVAPNTGSVRAWELVPVEN